MKVNSPHCINPFLKIFLFFILSQGFATQISNATTLGVQDIEDTYISLELNNSRLTKAFSEIEKRTEFNFTYDKLFVNRNQRLTASFQNASVGNILRFISEEAALQFKIINNNIHVITQETNVAPAVEKVVEPILEVAISGRVTDENGEGLPGVNIIIEGTAIGTVTDASGSFRMNVPSTQSVLQFSFIGYLTQQVTVGNRSEINVTMTPDVKALNEVVVVGYGTEQKALLTGSVGLVKSDQIKDLPVPSIDGALQGQVAGVQISQNSGTPGGGMSVRIRGISSIGSTNQPLYVVDGIPVTTGDFAQVGYEGQGINALTDLNPNDIASISVLKDASAASIYGARGTNGIVLITTKRGSNAKSTVNFNAYYGVQQVWKKLDMLNAKQWMEYRNDLNPGSFTQAQIDNPPINTNWQDVIFRTAPMANYELSTSGGNNKTKFFISGNYFDQDGTLIGTGYKRGNGRINVDHQVSDKFMLGTSIGLTYSKTNRVEGDQTLHGPLPNGISTPAIFPVYNEDGTYNQAGPYSNAVSIANEAINENFTFRTLGNIYGEYTILPGLTATSKWGVDFYNLREHAYESTKTVQGAKYNGLGFETYTNVLNFVSNNTLRYQKSFGKHNMEVMTGYSFEKRANRSSFIRGQDFADVNLQYLNSASTIVSASSSGLDEGLRSYFGRANYNFDNKYIVSLSGRVDASTRFGPNNRTGFFPAASAAWRLSEEDFIKNIPTISQLKVRMSYGITGNNDISPFLYAPLYSVGDSYGGQPGISPSSIPNPDLKWESTSQFDAGLDFGVMNDRLVITGDYYYKRTKDLLLSRPLPSSLGFSSITQNVGEVENKGVELTFQTQNIISGPLRWTSQLNLSANRNKVLKLYQNQPIDNLGRGSSRVEVGQPIGIFYSYRSLGVDPSTGDIVFADTDGDGEITTADRTKVGNPNPTFIGGFTNNLTYKGFDVSLFFQFSYGNDVFNGSRLFLESLQGGDNQIEAVTRRWRNPGDITDIPRATTDPVKATENKRISSRFIEDGSYMRLKNLTIGYTLNSNLVRKLSMTSLRVYFSGQNLWTLTNFTGLDPEVNYRGNDNDVIGTDFFTYPQARAFTFGINLKF